MYSFWLCFHSSATNGQWPSEILPQLWDEALSRYTHSLAFMEPGGRECGSLGASVSQKATLLPAQPYECNSFPCSAFTLRLYRRTKAKHARIPIARCPSPLQWNQMSPTSPSLTPRYQGPAATLQTRCLTLSFLAMGPAHFISKCSWLQNPSFPSALSTRNINKQRNHVFCKSLWKLLTFGCCRVSVHMLSIAAESD